PGSGLGVAEALQGVADHAVQRLGAIGGDRLALALLGSRERLVGAPEEDRRLLERLLPRASLGTDHALGEPAGLGEERTHAGRHRLTEAGRLLQAPVEGAEERVGARLRLCARAGGSRAGARAAHEARVGVRRALGGGRLQRVGRAGVGDAVAALRLIARTGGGPAHGGALHIAGARRAAAGAELGQVALAGGRPALDARGTEAVGRTGGAGPGARHGGVAGTRRRPALGAARLERVGRARGTLSGAVLGDVACAERRAADGRGGLQPIRGTRGARAGAGLGVVARAGGGPALERARAERVRRAVVSHAVAALGDVARPGLRPAYVRALRIGRAGRILAGAGL